MIERADRPAAAPPTHDRRRRLAASVAAGLAALMLGTTFQAAPATPDAPVVADADSDGRELRAATSPHLDGLLAAADRVRDHDTRGIPEPAEAAVTSSLDDGEDGQLLPLDLVVRSDHIDVDALAEPLAGASYAAPAVALTAAAAEHGGREVALLGIDGTAFRPLAPEITATADAVWERFAAGDALVSHELADELDLELGGVLELLVGGSLVEVRIGAFAANGAPPVADVLVPTAVTSQLGATAPNTLLVSAAADPAALGDDLVSATGGALDLRHDPAPAVTAQRTATETPSGELEPFRYSSHADGRITIEGDWVARNIVRVDLPGLGTTSCHRVMVPQLLAALDELAARGLADHLDPAQFAGCFVARHIDWDPSKPLSMHAWGLAIDVNARDNPLGAAPVMDREVVEVFARWGFDWGGHWRRPDGMHFELARIVPTG